MGDRNRRDLTTTKKRKKKGPGTKREARKARQASRDSRLKLRLPEK